MDLVSTRSSTAAAASELQPLPRELSFVSLACVSIESGLVGWNNAASANNHPSSTCGGSCWLASRRLSVRLLLTQCRLQESQKQQPLLLPDGSRDGVYATKHYCKAYSTKNGQYSIWQGMPSGVFRRPQVVALPRIAMKHTYYKRRATYEREVASKFVSFHLQRRRM